MKIKLTGEYQVDKSNLINEYMLLYESIIRWNEINEYNSQQHQQIHAYLYEDCINYQRLYREFSQLYKKSSSNLSLGIVSENQKIERLYVPFKEALDLYL